MHVIAIGSFAVDAARISRWGAAAAPVAIDAAAEATVVLLLAWAVTCIMRHASAATRHWVWLLALASLPAMPVLSVVLPAWRVLPAWGHAQPQTPQGVMVKQDVTVLRPAPMRFDAAETTSHPKVVDLIEHGRPRQAVAHPDAVPSMVPITASTKSPAPAASVAHPIVQAVAAPARAAPRMPDVWGWALIAWAVGAAGVLAMPLAGLISLTMLARRARAIADPGVVAAAGRLSVELRLPRPVTLLEMTAALPMTWGIFRPRVLLPSEAVDWPPERLDAVLLHEFGHVLRRDCLAEWVARIACAAYWFHPLAWVAARRLAKEREAACDDLVLSRGQDAPAYAGHLLHVVTAAAHGGFPSRVAIPMARTRGLESRVRSILDGRPSRRPPTRRYVLLLCAVAAALVLPLAMTRAQLSRPLAGPTTAPVDVRSAAPTTPATRPAALPATQPVEARLTVRVLDEAGRPVAQAKVRLVSYYPLPPDKKYYATYIAPDVTTAADGKATLIVTPPTAADVPGGATLHLLALAAGHAPTHVRQPKLSADDSVDIRLTRGQPISGIVRRPDGTPLAHAAVCALYHEYVASLPDEFMQDYAPAGTSDDQGKFTLDHVAAASYMITAADEASSPPLCTEARNVDVVPDRPAFPLELTARPAAIIKGRIVTTHGVPVDRFPISVSVRTPTSNSWRVKVQADGSFTASGIPAAASGIIAPLRYWPYVTEADWPGAPPGCEPLQISLMSFAKLAPGVYSGLQFHIYEPAKLHAVVLDEAGKPFEKVDVIPMPYSYVFFTDVAGKATADVPPGVDVTVEFHDGDLAENQKTAPLRLKEGESVERRYVFRRAAAAPSHDHFIAGQVVDADGRPVEGAIVELGNHALLPRTVLFNIGHTDVKQQPTWTGGMFGPPNVTSDAQGRFRFDMLLVGRTDVWADKDLAAWGWVRDVGVDTDKLTVSIRPPAVMPPEFSGRVVDEAGKSVAGAIVTAFDGEVFRETPVLAATVSDAEGHYALKLKSLPTKFGEHVRLICRAPDQRVTWKSVPACGGEDIRLAYGPEASVSGRVVDKKGDPLGGARVWLRLCTDPDAGAMDFTNSVEPYAPLTQTAPDGTFTLKGLRGGSVVSLFAKHPLTWQGDRWYVNAVAPDTNVGDITVKDGVSLSGRVHFADGRPAAGAEVKFTRPFGGEDVALTRTDASGAYQLKGLPADSQSPQVSALLDEGPGYEAHAPLAGWLRAGDAIEGFDLTLQQSWSARHVEWLRQLGTAQPSRFGAVIVDDHIDVNDTGRRTDEHAGEVIALDADGAARWQHKPLSLWPLGDHNLAASGDGGCYVHEYGNAGLTRFAASGEVAWRKENFEVWSMATDPQTGKLWVLQPDYSGEQRGHLIVLGPDGKPLQNWPMKGSQLAYSAHDHCFWLLGEKLAKIDLDGKVLAQVTLAGDPEGELSVNEGDGSVWVTYWSTVPEDTKRQLLVVSSDGRVLRQSTASDRTVVHFTVDGPRNVVWARVWEGNRRHIERQSLLDRHRLGDPLPIDGDIAVEPDTGCAWIAGPDGIGRLDPEGKPIWFHPTPGNTGKAIVLVSGQ